MYDISTVLSSHFPSIGCKLVDVRAITVTSLIHHLPENWDFRQKRSKGSGLCISSDTDVNEIYQHLRPIIDRLID